MQGRKSGLIHDVTISTMAVNGQGATATKGGGRTTPDKLNRVDFNWHIVRTLPHQESKLAAMLGERLPGMENILEVYCPTHTTVSVVREGRAAQSPLFAGYVFVLSTEEALMEFIAAHYPDGTVMHDRRKADGMKAGLLAVPESQMRAFMDFNENYADKVVILERPYSDYAFNPKTGEPNEIVRVVDGPLAGREGYITRFRRDKRLVFNMKAPHSGKSFAVSVPNIWDFHVVRLHNAEGDRLSVGTEKGRAVDLLVGLLQGCGYGGQARPMLLSIVGALAARPSLVELCGELGRQGHGELARKVASVGKDGAGLLLNLARYERNNPGYVGRTWLKVALRPFLTPTSGADMKEGEAEAQLPHDGFTEIIRRVEITEEVYYPTKEKGEAATTTYYAHIGVAGNPAPALHRVEMAGVQAECADSGFAKSASHPSPRGVEPERGFVLFANWDAFLGQYFLTAGKANEKLVSGMAQVGRAGGTEVEKLIESFRNFAPALYKVLVGEGSNVRAVQGFKVGGDTVNVLAVRASAAGLARAKDELIATCTAICREINSTTHLALWRRYLRGVWLHG